MKCSKCGEAKRLVKGKGLCEKCYNKSLKRRVYKKAKCAFCGEVKFIAAHKLCRACNQRRRNNGSPKYIKVRKVCTINGCENLSVAKGLCDMHRKRVEYSKQTQEKKELRARRSKNKTLKERFGITLDEYESILLKQNGVCAICGKEETHMQAGKIKPQGLCVDHCHATGEVRALLCSNCNIGLGRFRESPEIMLKAIDYLNSHWSGKEEPQNSPSVWRGYS